MNSALVRALGAAAMVVFVAVFALAFFPGPLVLLVCLVLPAGASMLVSGWPYEPVAFARNGFAGSLALGATGAAWLGLRADDGDALPAVIIGAVVSFVLLTLMGQVGCYVAGRLFERRAAREPGEPFEDDDD